VEVRTSRHCVTSLGIRVTVADLIGSTRLTATSLTFNAECLGA
jgi:hypothetical protein